MRKLTLIIYLCLLLGCTFTSIAGVNSMFVQRKGEAGWLYHIFPQKMPSLDKKTKNINYDFTFTEETDSVTLLATVITASPLKPKTLHIESCGRKKEYDVETLYLIPHGSKYEYRILAKMPFGEWTSLYDCPNPYVLRYVFGEDSPSEEYSFSYGVSKWKSKRKDLLIIINTIKLNTGK